MKKLFVLLMMMVLLSGCAKEQPTAEHSASSEQQSDQLTQQQSATIVEEVVRLWNIPQPVYLDEQDIAELLEIKEEWVTEGWGVASAQEDRPDLLIFIDPEDQKAEKVEKRLEERLDFLMKAFPQEQTIGSVLLTGSGPVLIVTGDGSTPEETQKLLEEYLGSTEES